MTATLAAVLRDPEAGFTLEHVELHGPGPGEVLVEIAGCGFCHTDLLPLRADRPVPLPLVLGHEGAGVVVELGAGVRDLDVGDHVVLSFDSCGSCPRCRDAAPAYCDTFFARNLGGHGIAGSAGMVGPDGGAIGSRWFGQSSFARHAVVAAANAVPVARDLPLEMLGPLGCGVQTGAGAVLLALRVQAADRLLVAGAGAVGLSAVMAARTAGASITVVEPNPARAALAADLGADAVAADIAEVGDGFDFSLDTTGIPEVARRAVDVLHARGTCGLVGIPRADLTFDRRALAAGRTVTGIFEGSAVPQLFIPRLIGLWRDGRFPFDRLITRYPLEQINDAVLAAGSGAAVKPVLIPGR